MVLANLADVYKQTILLRVSGRLTETNPTPEAILDQIMKSFENILHYILFEHGLLYI
jgi:hypothetical protein